MIPTESDSDYAEDLRRGDWIDRRPGQGRGYVVDVEPVGSSTVRVTVLNYDTGRPITYRSGATDRWPLRRHSPRCSDCGEPTVTRDHADRCPWCAKGKKRPTAPPKSRAV